VFNIGFLNVYDAALCKTFFTIIHLYDIVQGYSTSETWYAFLDYGTNYCNLHNLITGLLFFCFLFCSTV